MTWLLRNIGFLAGGVVVLGYWATVGLVIPGPIDDFFVTVLWGIPFVLHLRKQPFTQANRAARRNHVAKKRTRRVQAQRAKATTHSKSQQVARVRGARRGRPRSEVRKSIGGKGLRKSRVNGRRP